MKLWQRKALAFIVVGGLSLFGLASLDETPTQLERSVNTTLAQAPDLKVSYIKEIDSQQTLHIGIEVNKGQPFEQLRSQMRQYTLKVMEASYDVNEATNAVQIEWLVKGKDGKLHAISGGKSSRSVFSNASYTKLLKASDAMYSVVIGDYYDVNPYGLYW